MIRWCNRSLHLQSSVPWNYRQKWSWKHLLPVVRRVPRGRSPGFSRHPSLFAGWARLGFQLPLAATHVEPGSFSATVSLCPTDIITYPAVKWYHRKANKWCICFTKVGLVQKINTTIHSRTFQLYRGRACIINTRRGLQQLRSLVTDRVVESLRSISIS